MILFPKQNSSNSKDSWVAKPSLIRMRGLPLAWARVSGSNTFLIHYRLITWGFPHRNTPYAEMESRILTCNGVQLSSLESQQGFRIRNLIYMHGTLLHYRSQILQAWWRADSLAVPVAVPALAANCDLLSPSKPGFGTNLPGKL